jgi:hypothetical protein
VSRSITAENSETLTVAGREKLSKRSRTSVERFLPEVEQQSLARFPPPCRGVEASYGSDAGGTELLCDLGSRGAAVLVMGGHTLAGPDTSLCQEKSDPWTEPTRKKQES